MKIIDVKKQKTTLTIKDNNLDPNEFAQTQRNPAMSPLYQLKDQMDVESLVLSGNEFHTTTKSADR